MPTLFAASESSVMIDKDPIDGVRAIDYRQRQVRQNVYALGSVERVGMVSGGQVVEGRLVVASTCKKLNDLTGDQSFQVVATFKHGKASMTVTLFDCYLLEKSFGIAVDGSGEATYSFTATRVHEDVAVAA